MVHRHSSRPSRLTTVKSCRAGVFAAMNTLVRNATSNFSRRGVDGYELLDQSEEKREENHVQTQTRTFSKRRAHSVVASLSYRRDRAKRRQIFLKSYKLSSLDDNWGRQPDPKSRKLKKIVVKVKTVVVSLVSFMRMGSLKSCNCRSAIYAAAPIAIKKCC